MTILNLFYDLLNLDIPAVCDSYDAALKSLCKYIFYFENGHCFIVAFEFQVFDLSIYYIYIDQIWDLTTVEEGYTYVASEGAAKLSRLSSTRYIFICSNYCLFY
jgi:hypothetical protein